MFLTGMLAAEATFGVLHEGSNMEAYWDALRNSWVWEELHKARNYRPVSEAFQSLFIAAFPLVSSCSILYLLFIQFYDCLWLLSLRANLRNLFPLIYSLKRITYSCGWISSLSPLLYLSNW